MRLPMVISAGAAVAAAFVTSVQADTFQVTTTAESGAGSLKQAILDGVAEWRHGPLTDDMSLVLVELR